MRRLDDYNILILALVALAAAPSGWWGSWALLAVAFLLEFRDRIASCILAAAGILASGPETAWQTVLVSIAGFLHAWYSPPGRPWRMLQPARYMVVVLLISPAAVLNPPLLAAVTGMAAGALARYSRAASSLSGVRLEASAPKRVYVGSKVPVLVRVYGPPGSYYEVAVTGAPAVRGRIPDSGVASESIEVRARRLGVHRLRVRVRVYDPGYTASADIGSVEVAFTAISRMAAARDKLAELLSMAAGTVGLPRLLLARSTRGGETDSGWRPAWAVLEAAPVPVLGLRELPEAESIRHYVPGDPPRLIYWKKSVSRGRIIVKQLSKRTSRESRLPPGRVGLVIAADLTCWDWAELEKLVAALIDIILSAPGEVVLLLRLPGGGEYLMAGRPLDVSNALEAILTREPLSPVGVSDGPPASRPPLVEVPGSLRPALDALARRVERDVEALTAVGIRGDAYYFVLYSPLQSTWAGMMAGALEAAGLRRYTPPVG